MYVTWLADSRVFEPDRIFDALLDEFGFDDAEDPPRSGDLPSVERAAAELRRAGFRDVAAAGASSITPSRSTSYIAFLTEFDEETLFDEMTRQERRRFLARLRERLMALDPDELRVPGADRLRGGHALRRLSRPGIGRRRLADEGVEGASIRCDQLGDARAGRPDRRDLRDLDLDIAEQAESAQSARSRPGSSSVGAR